MEIEKGKILVRGENIRKYLNSKKGLMKMFFTYVFASIICIFLLILSLMDILTINGSGLIPAVIILFPLLISISAIWVYNPKKWDWLDITYENGISSSYGPFLPFLEINKIGFGTMDDGSKFIQLFSKNRHWKICPDIREKEFKNNYYAQAEKILKQKCPNVPWVEMKWLEWKQ